MTKNGDEPCSSQGLQPTHCLAALRHRDYRLLWTGTLVSNSGDWLDMVALNWLVVAQNGSAMDLAFVNLCRALPIIALTLVGGAVSDRFERRKLLIYVQIFSMFLAVILTAMTLANATPVWALALISVGRGAALAFNLPARHSIIPSLVPRELLPNAVALNSVTLNATKVLGPMLAGLLIAQLGLATCFAVNAVSYLGVLWTLHKMSIPPTPAQPRPVESLMASISSGIRYVLSRQVLLLLVLVSLLPVFLGQPFIMLLAVFAHEALQWGPVGLGVLTSAAGVGSMIGALAIGGFAGLLRQGKVMLFLLLGFGFTLIGLAVNPFDMIAPLILIFAGAAYMSYNTALTTLIQLMVTDEYRGRVMSTMLINRGLMPLGTSAAAALSAFVGIRMTYGVMGGLIIVFALVLLVFSQRLRELKV